jgi:hypothetical protein
VHIKTKGVFAVGAAMAMALGGTAPPAHAQVQSRIIASDGKGAMDCVRLEKIADPAGNSPETQWVLANGCADEVEVGWCKDDECSREAGNRATVKPGRSWPVAAVDKVYWGACHGKNTFHGETGSKGTRHYCTAVDEATRDVDPEDPEELIESVEAPPVPGTILRRGGNTGADAVADGFARAEQWERDAPLREAEARAEAARQAQRDREYAEWQRKREEKKARQASGSDGWSTFFNVLGAAAGAAAQQQGSSQPASTSSDAQCIASNEEGRKNCDCLRQGKIWSRLQGKCV